MASLRKICLVIKVMKQKRLISKVNHVKYTVFFDPLSETAFCTGMYSIYGICLFRQAMKRGYTEFDRSEICFIFSLSRWTKLVNRNMILLNVSHKILLSQSMSAVSCIPSIFITNDLSNSSRVKKGHRVTLPSQLSGRYCMKRKRKRKRKRKKKRNLHFLHSVNFTEFRPFDIRYYSVSSRGICQNRTAGYWSF